MIRAHFNFAVVWLLLWIAIGVVTGILTDNAIYGYAGFCAAGMLHWLFALAKS